MKRKHFDLVYDMIHNKIKRRKEMKENGKFLFFATIFLFVFQ